METDMNPNQSQRWGRLRSLAETSRKRLGPGLKQMRLPARLLVDADPWTISLHIEITEISTMAVHAKLRLSDYPADMEQILIPGDLFRLQLNPDLVPDPDQGILPLLPARLENKITDESGARNEPEKMLTELRLKWLLGGSTERSLIEYLSGLQSAAVQPKS